MHLFTDPARHPGWPIRTESLRVRAGSVALRPVRRRDGADWSRLRMEDAGELARWEPSPEGRWEDHNSRAAWAGVYPQHRRSARVGAVVPAVIELDGRYCGQITIGGIGRGSLSSAWVGYWVARRYAGAGVASAALALALQHAFGPVGLHRVEATVRPENAASRTVLERCGMREEGLLRRYLHVDGRWRDHLLVAVTAEEHGARGAIERLRERGVTPALADRGVAPGVPGNPTTG